MKTLIYYNEIDPFCIDWLWSLMQAGAIPEGIIDDRSIEDVKPEELEPFDQCHFFAGIGVWAYTLKQARWGDRPVWTGSCPCQPFSAAGKSGGFDDERHLWPAFHHLIRVRRPGVVFGEQVASKHGLTWLDLAQADLEGESYTVGAVDTCAAGFGAPHIRQRLYWVAKPNSGGLERASEGKRERGCPDALCESDVDNVGNTNNPRPQGRGLLETTGRGNSASECAPGTPMPTNGRDMANTEGTEQQGCEHQGGRTMGQGAVNGFWADADWLPCRDDKARAVEPGTFPLVDGSPNRVGRLRGYGNAIVAPQAEAFVRAFMEIYP